MCCSIIGNIIDFCIMVVAIIAACISYKEWYSHKTKEYNKLLSQLNERYINNKDIQTVVKYLRYTEPSDSQPDAYQIDLFLRFFEELGVYLENNSIKKEDVRNFFNYYIEQFFKPEGRGKLLRLRSEYNKWDLHYLETYKKIMGICEKQEKPQDDSNNS